MKWRWRGKEPEEYTEMAEEKNGGANET